MCCVCLVSCKRVLISPHTLKAIELQDQKRIVAFGDSHTYGVILQPISWVDDLRKRINLTKITEKNYRSDFNTWYELDNQSMGGSKLDSKYQFQRLMKYDFKSNDTVVMILGFNDIVYNGTDANKLNQFKTQLIEALNRIKNSGAATYIGTCIIVPDSSYKYMKKIGEEFGVDTSRGSKQSCNLYAQATREIVQKFTNVRIVETNIKLKLHKSDLIDHVHFNWNIHLKISKMFLQEIIL